METTDMQNKSNTNQIIEIWMKACFERLMAEPKAETEEETEASPKTLGEQPTLTKNEC